MQRLLWPLSLSLLLTVSLPAFGQASEGTPGSSPERVRPLNLSLPQDDALSSPWSTSTSANETAKTNLPSAEHVQSGSRETGCNCQRTGRDERGGLPYGTGFEARQRGGAGSRGMGRGR